MKTKQAIWGGLAVAVIAAGALYFFWPRPAPDIATGPLLSFIPQPGDLNALPAPAAGAPGAAAQPPANLGGTSATGRIDGIYIRVAEGVLVELARAPTTAGWRYASLEFPDSLANGTTVARALVPTGMISDVRAGDVVEMRFANKEVSGPYVAGFRLLPERDQITKVIAKSGTDVAKDYQRRILARTGADPASGAVPDVALWKQLPLEQSFTV